MKTEALLTVLAVLLGAVVVMFRGRSGPSKADEEMVDDLLDKITDDAQERRDEEIADAAADAAAVRGMRLKERARAALDAARRVLGSGR